MGERETGGRDVLPPISELVKQYTCHPGCFNHSDILGSRLSCASENAELRMAFMACMGFEAKRITQ